MGTEKIALILTTAATLGCGAVDPRCSTACNDPNAKGTGVRCKLASVNHCVDACHAQIKDQTSLCQTCLVEGASLNLGEVLLEDDASSSASSCTYFQSKLGDRERCLAQVSSAIPLVVSCTATFRPVVECSAICSTQPWASAAVVATPRRLASPGSTPRTVNPSW